MCYKIRYNNNLYPMQACPETTLEDFMAEVRDITGVLPSKQSITFNFPPQPLPRDSASLPLPMKHFGVMKREMFQLNVVQPNETASPKKGKVLKEAIKHPIAGDNSCLFNSISYLCTGNDKNAPALRQIIISEIRSHPDIYTPVTLGTSAQEYCNWINDPNHWGGYIEMGILSRYFQVEICVMNIETCQPLFVNSSTSDKRIYILYDNIHYDSIAFLFNKNEQRIVLQSDDDAFLCALEMTRDLQSAGCYTNTKTFKIRCEQCGITLHGENEARDHQKHSGHTRFVQVN